MRSHRNAFISSGAAQELLLILLGGIGSTSSSGFTLITRKVVSEVHNILGERLLVLQLDSIRREFQSLKDHPKLCLKLEDVTLELFKQFDFNNFYNIVQEKAPYTCKLIEGMCGY